MAIFFRSAVENYSFPVSYSSSGGKLIKEVGEMVSLVIHQILYDTLLRTESSDGG